MAPFQAISFHFIPFHSIPFRSRPFDSIVPEEYIRHYVRALTSVPVKAFPQEFRSPKNFVYQSYAVCRMIASLILYSTGVFHSYNGREMLLRGNTKRSIRGKSITIWKIYFYQVSSSVSSSNCEIKLNRQKLYLFVY